jgi:hypothetical protein
MNIDHVEKYHVLNKSSILTEQVSNNSKFYFIQGLDYKKIIPVKPS